MRELASAGFVKAAIDNSDGLLPSLQQLAAANDLHVEIELERLDSSSGGKDDWRLSLGWGDWNVLAAIEAEHLEAAQRVAHAAGSDVISIGQVVPGAPGVTIRRGDLAYAEAPRLESERFSGDSWFHQGIGAYMDRLLSVELSWRVP
jgi:thiamine monophosphate kinase